MLAEATAWALLERHCELLDMAVATADPQEYATDTTKDFARDRVDVVVKLPMLQMDSDWRDLGARMRLALDVAHAVAFCQGFEVTSNLPFWRRFTTSLWHGPGAVSNHDGEWLALSPMAFARVGVAWRAYKINQDDFWIGFLHGSASCAATLASVHLTLQPFLPSPPPPVQVVLLSCSTGRSPPQWDDGSNESRVATAEVTVEPEALKTILRAALADTGSKRSAMETHLDVVFDYRVDDNIYATRETLDLVERVQALPWLHLTIGRLAIQLIPPTPPRHAGADRYHRRAFVARARNLGSLLRALLVDSSACSTRVAVESVAVLGCSHSDYRLVGAALSAVAGASPPKVSDLLCGRLGDNALPRDEVMLRLAWLAYTLLHGPNKPSWALSLSATGCMLNQAESQYLTALVARGMPLRDVMGDALRLRFGGDDGQVARLRTVDCLAFGSTVRLARGTTLFFEPFRGSSNDVVAVTLGSTNEEDVAAIAHVVGRRNDAGWVAIVYAGYGLVWVHASRVAAWQRVDQSASTTIQVTLSALSLRFDAREPAEGPVAGVLSFIATTELAQVRLSGTTLSQNDLAVLLSSVPRLHSLSLDRCVVESLTPLVDAYARHLPRVAVLSLLSTRSFHTRDAKLSNDGFFVKQSARREALAWLRPLIDAIARGLTNGILRELHVELEGVHGAPARHMLKRLANAMISTARSLARLHVACGSCEELLATCLELFAPLRDTVLPDRPRVRLVVLSVLRLVGIATPEIAQSVLALAEGAVKRTVTWTPSGDEL